MSNSDSIITYGLTSSLPSFQHISVSSYSFEDTIKVLKAAIESESMWLIHEIDPQMLLKREGLEILCTRQLLFFHPRYMKKLLGINPNALIEAPLKFVVMQMPNNTVSVHYLNIEMQFNRYNNFEEFAEELSQICKRLIRSVST
jgi:uncharacterized protein (DUF302 family)